MAFQSGHSTTLISKGSEIIGDIKFSGELEVQGVICGNIYANADTASTVRVVDGGRVEGEIHAPKIIINGEIEGDVHSSEHVELAAKAAVRGDVHYSLIEMVKGAQLNGNLVYAGDSQKVANLEAVGPKDKKAG
jgi:cytoskeletal protein CcmA (bactofilin family)